MVHKRKTVKGIAASTQSMAVRNPILGHYCSEEHCEEAIKTYTKKKKRQDYAKYT